MPLPTSNTSSTLPPTAAPKSESGLDCVWKHHKSYAVHYSATYTWYVPYLTIKMSTHETQSIQTEKEIPEKRACLKSQNQFIGNCRPGSRLRMHSPSIMLQRIRGCASKSAHSQWFNDRLIDWLGKDCLYFFSVFLKNHSRFGLHFCFIQRMISMPMDTLELAEFDRLFFPGSINIQNAQTLRHIFVLRASSWRSNGTQKQRSIQKEMFQYE